VDGTKGHTVVTRPPAELVDLVRERRVIPFVGAGFSVALGLPSWSELLAKLSAETEGSLSYGELDALTNSDPLQIAEYLYLKSDARIGPLRHTIEQMMPSGLRPELSAAHVELVNIGAGQIYTTNYDDLIEETYRRLGLEVQKVALAKDVALAQTDVPQVVKYHGDLRHEETLVLTESSYYARLDFESPMDLKFRSDLLGRSVLFMGYSFRDINIRVIWFKLMQMMKDIPQGDRLPSYMVRVEPNPALEELNRAVGLRTVVLDPEREARTDDARSFLLAEFLHSLADTAAVEGLIPGTNQPLFASAYLPIAIARTERERRASGAASVGRTQRLDRTDLYLITRLMARRIPDGLLSDTNILSEEDLLATLGRALGRGGGLLNWQMAVGLLAGFAPSEGLTYFTARAMSDGFVRQAYFQAGWEELPWQKFWGAKLNAQEARRILADAEDELEYHETEERDEDLAYDVDLVTRLVEGQIYGAEGEDDPLIERGQAWLNHVAEMYPAVLGYRPDPGGPPVVEEILTQIDAAKQSEPAEDTAAEEYDLYEIPFHPIGPEGESPAGDPPSD
jgi:hypothetical protein